MSVPSLIETDLQSSEGATFFRCAFQVNPFDYLIRHNKQTSFSDEHGYNEAIARACVAHGVQIVGITDHFRVSSSSSLIKTLSERGVSVFPGFEACSSEGIHVLCLYPLGTEITRIERYLGAFEIARENAASPISKKSCAEILDIVDQQGGFVIAAHACSANGILTSLKRSARSLLWEHEKLFAIGLPGSRDDAPPEYRQIVNNKDPEYVRKYPVAVVNTNDVISPECITKSSTTTFIKMSHISIEGLRQACLDWRSRIRLNSEDTPQAHAEIRAVSWIGGLLDQERLTFNPHLNVLIGGRGAGKSTLIESIRFAFSLSPRTKEAKANHDKIVGSVIGRGSIVNVAFWSPYPTPQIYVIERIDAGQPRVFDQQGRLIPDLHPSDFASGLEVYGQHEVSELTRDGVQLAALLRRFIPAPAPDEDTRVDVLQGLQRSREAILADESEADRLRERLASLPGMREQLKRFGEAGLAEHFTEKDLYDLEAREFEAVEEALEAGSVEAHELAPSGFVEAHDGEEAPEASEMPAFRNTELLTQLPPIVKSVEAARGRARAYLRGRLEAARDQYKGIRTSWDELYADMMRKMEETIKKLEAEGLDAKKYVSLKEKVDDLQRLEKQLSDILSGLFEKYQKRMELISDWDRIKAADLRKLEKAARKVSSKLSGKVRVRINPKLSIEKVERILRDHTTGNISQPLEILGDLGSLDLSHFAARVREGKDALVREYGFTEAGAQKIAAAERTLALLIEEAEIEPQAIVELNVGSKENPIWKDLENLSTGQKATAVLLLILLGSEAPLVIDQPEDDLDNRFIADVIVETMRDEKQNRQLIFSSHNANIPVLADAELIVGLTTEVEDGVERTIIPAEYRGSIDTRTVSELVKEILEGGKDAFETRRRRYGF